jgi:hypothetical protein
MTLGHDEAPLYIFKQLYFMLLFVFRVLLIILEHQIFTNKFY